MALPYDDILLHPQLLSCALTPAAGRCKVEPDSGHIYLPLESNELIVADLLDDSGDNDKGGETDAIWSRLPACLSEQLPRQRGRVLMRASLDENARGCALLRPCQETGRTRIAIGQNQNHVVLVARLDATLSKDKGGFEITNTFGTVGEHAKTSESFYYPQDIGVTYSLEPPTEHIVVNDGPNDRVKIINSETGVMFREFEVKWPWGMAVNDGERALAEGRDPSVFVTVNGQQLKEFSLVTGEELRLVASDSSGNVCAVDSMGCCLYMADQTPAAGPVIAIVVPGAETRYVSCPWLPAGTVGGIAIDERRQRLIISMTDSTTNGQEGLLIALHGIGVPMVKSAGKR